MELEQMLSQLQTELKGFVEKAREEQKTTGSVLKQTQTEIDNLTKKFSDLQAQADAIDKRVQGQAFSGEGKSLLDELKENAELAALMQRKRGSVQIQLSPRQALNIIERKTTISSSAVGFPTYGVMPADRRPGIVPEARATLGMRDAIPSRPTTFGEVYWVKVNAAMAIASPQTQASDKAENAVTFTTDKEVVETIATWIPATRQVLDDWSELEGFLRTTLSYYVNKDEDLQLLSGSGVSPNLNGINTQAQSFDTTLLVNADGWTKIDIVGRAVQQIAADNELPPDFVVLHPKDWWDMRLTKDSDKNYMLNGPVGSDGMTLWGLRVIPTTMQTSGYFSVGSSSPAAAEIRDRMGLTIDISTEHSDYFIKNMVAIRAEKRLTLAVYRPNAFVYGAFTTSPS